MPTPSIALKPGQIVVTPLTSEDATINGTNIQSGTIVMNFSLLGYVDGDVVSITKNKVFPFTNSDPDVPYLLANEEDVLFKVILPP